MTTTNEQRDAPDLTVAAQSVRATVERSASAVAAHRTASHHDEPAPPFTHQQIVQVITGILLCIFLAAIDQTVVVPAVPAIAAELQGFGHLSWIVSSYLLTATAATPIYGKLSDIYGRRRMLIVALILFAATSVLCAVAQSLSQLIAFRALQGLGGAGLMAMSQAAIADVVSPRERGRYQGYMAGVWGVASVGGPVLGGFLTQHLSWRWIFGINLPLSILAMVLCYRALRLLKAGGAVNTRIDYLGAALLTGTVSALLMMLSFGAETSWTSPLVLGLLAAGLVLGFILFWHQRRIDDPLLPPRLFGNQIIVRGIATAFCATFTLFGATFLLPLYFQLVRGAEPGVSGMLVVPFLGANAAGAYLAGWLARRIGRTRGILTAGLALCVASLAVLATIGPATPTALLVIYQLALGIGIGMLMPTCVVIVQNAAERRDIGIATGSLLQLRSVGGAFGSALVGAVLTNRLAASLAATGTRQMIDLGEIHQGSAALAALGPAVQQAVRAGLLQGFHMAFLACAAVMVGALLMVRRMEDLPLRSSAGETKPAALAH